MGCPCWRVVLEASRKMWETPENWIAKKNPVEEKNKHDPFRSLEGLFFAMPTGSQKSPEKHNPGKSEAG